MPREALTEAQLDGRACLVCAEEGGAMVPVDPSGGPVGRSSTGSQTFVHERCAPAIARGSELLVSVMRDQGLTREEAIAFLTDESGSIEGEDVEVYLRHLKTGEPLPEGHPWSGGRPR